MRVCVPLLLLVFPVPVRADDPAALIHRAARAQAGSMERLAGKLKIVTSVARGTVVTTEETPATRRAATELPSRARYTLGLGVDGAAEFVLDLQPDRGSIRAGTNTVKDLTLAQVDEMRDLMYAHWVASLVPLTGDGFTLAALPDAEVGGKPAAGIRVNRRGRPEVTLYFDKTSGLLVKMAYQGKEAGLPLAREVLYSDYKEFDGVLLPSKQVEMKNGKKEAEWSFSEYRFPEKMPEK